jgi:hypothetical protein
MINLNVYLLTSLYPVDYEMTDGMVVIAADEDEARLIADESERGTGWWLDAEYVSCVLVSLAKSGVVMKSNTGA